MKLQRQRRTKRMSIVSCTILAAIATSTISVAASPGGGVLPPPPPPPPQQKQSILSESGAAIMRDNSIATTSTPDEPSAEQSGGETDAESKEPEKITEASVGSPLKPISDSTSDNAGKFSIWGEESGGAGESAPQQPLQPLSDHQWGSDTSAQYPGQYNNYQQQWPQQPQTPLWGQSYQQPQQQQRYYQQQTHQQQYPPQPGQLAVYRRPAPRRQASGLFSLAVKKLQTGIDSVSESIDVNKVASSVSGITSRLGEIGSNIAGSTGRAAPARSIPPNVGRRNMMPGPRNPMAGAGRDPRMGQQHSGQQGGYPQRLPPRSRQRSGKQETYAPPITDLYSLEQQGLDPVPVDDDGSVDQGGVDGPDATDVEDESYLDMMQKQSAPAQPALSGEAPQPQPFPDEGQSPPFRMEEPRTSPPQSDGRAPQSFTPLPRNSGFAPPSTGAGRRRYEDFDDDDGSSSIGHKVKSALGAFVPRVPNPFKRESDLMYDDGAWSDDEGSSGRGFFSGRSKAKDASYVPTSSRGASAKYSIIPRPVRSLLEKRETMMSSASAKKCASVGRSQAFLDAGQVALLTVVLREVVPLFFDAMSKANDAASGGGIRQAIATTILSATDGWAPLALAAIFLLSASNNAWIQPQLKFAYIEAATENTSDAAYAQLYLRLIAALPMQKSFSSEVMKKTARAKALQIASLARLRAFVSLVIIYVLLSTVAVLRPAGLAVMSAVAELVRMIPPISSWREADWKRAIGSVTGAGLALGRDLGTLIGTEWSIVKEQPLRVAVVVSLTVALLAVSALPSLERGSSRPVDDLQNEEEEEDTITSLWSNVGASSATRLGLLSSPRGVEGALEQFAKLRPDRAAAAGIALPGGRPIKKKRRRRQSADGFDVSAFLKHVLYSASSLALLSVPLSIYLYLLANSEVDGSRVLSLNAIPESGWMSLLELATLLVFTHLQAGNAVSATIQANAALLGHSVSSFFQKLADTVNEVQKLSAESSSTADFQAMLTANPTKGISVSDLWAAHSSKRSWAVKGANLQCKNGEVVLIVGADGAGKTRLLTSVAERIFAPPKSARTTQYVRGAVHVGGVELAKWDLASVQKRVGVFLNDVRTISDYASLMTGCTLDEVLEPVPLEGGRIGPKERNSMSVAMKITGIRSDLMARLPSKLATVVSANEDELNPSPLRPPSSPLSPEDWTRVLLTKILAQLISGNENQLSSPDTVRKCMIGSILLLDDATTQMSETNEARFISALRSTGAAVLLTSSRWATGRFADRIVVIDGGSVVESGTHADLLALGPERSLYARQWSAMS